MVIKSSWELLKRGFPQGTVLVVLFFLNHINDLDEEINYSVFKFAEETKLATYVGNLILNVCTL